MTSNAEANFGATLSKIMEPFRAQNSSRADMASMNRGSPTGSKTRAQEAAEVFHGFMSSDSENNDESEDSSSQDSEMPADKASQYKSARGATNACTSLRTDEGESALVVLAVDGQAIKKEPGTSLPPLLRPAEIPAGPKALVVPLEIEHVPKFEIEVNFMESNTMGRPMATRKRDMSALAVAPATISKRPRLTGENLNRLMRSCSRVATE